MKTSKAADSEETREPVSIGEEEKEEEMKVAGRVEEAAEDSISATTGSSEGNKLKSKGKKKKTEKAAGDSISAVSEGRKPKGKKKKRVGEALANGVPTSTTGDTDSTATSGKKQKKKKRRPKVPSSAAKKLSSARLKSYGL